MNENGEYVPLPKSGPEREARIKRQKQFRKLVNPLYEPGSSSASDKEKELLAEWERLRDEAIENTRQQAEFDRKKAEYEALPLITIICNSTSNALIIPVHDYTIQDPLEECSVCPFDLGEEGFGEDEDGEVKSPTAHLFSKLNCSCGAKSHFDCLNEWLQKPTYEYGVRVSECPKKCGDKFRIRWVGADGKVEGEEAATSHGKKPEMGGGAMGVKVEEDLGEEVWDVDAHFNKTAFRKYM